MNWTRHLEQNRKLTGKPRGSAHRYRVNRPQKQYGAYVRKWMGYLEERVQEDGSSKFFIVDYVWEDYIGGAMTMMGNRLVENVLEFSSLEAAMGEWKRDELRRARAELRRARTQALGAEKERQRREIKKALRERVVAPITQGVASEGVEKPLPKVEVCRWCKGDPRGLLMLNKYVPCTECSPIVTQVHDEIVCEVPEKGGSYEQMDGRRRLVEEIRSQQMDMSWVKDELYVPVPDTVLRQKMVEQGGPSKKAIEDLKEYAREKGYELRAPVSADEAREEQKLRAVKGHDRLLVVDVQDHDFPRRSARRDGINWVIPLSETEKKQMEDRVLRVAKSRDGLTHRPGAEKAAEKFKAEKGKT